jgi:hypothetical protein
MIYRFSFLLLLTGLLAGCRQKAPTLFEALDSSRSGITFNNRIDDNDTLNVLDVENIYNGGGVGVGDFNGDSLPDLYFTGNAVPNALYLNRGSLKFEEVTQASGTGGENRWSRGVSLVDINNDGRLDIYVSATLAADPRRRENLLYVNQGANKGGVPRFVNQAAAYGLADTSYTTMTAFFDYDNDGDLDAYLLNNQIIKNEYPNTFRPVLQNGEHPNTDKLLRNDWDSSKGHPVFTDVSRAAGILWEGYGHGVNITDFNGDGWKDIYVTNDFLPNNLLYINQRNGTFRNEVKKYFKHTSENSMGQDVIDINNDALPDVIEVDMNPQDNLRKKMMLMTLGYQRFTNAAYYGYQHQYVRNVLQVNQGPSVGPGDSISHPVFSETALLSGIAETDWSWTPSVADFDNDGFRDLVVTNGFPKDVTDHDFMTYRMHAHSVASKREILNQIPEVKISNYAFRNNGDLTFSDVTKDWGLWEPRFSSGAVHADLDRDGDLDYVVNNINDKAQVYENHQRARNGHHYLNVGFTGPEGNRNGIGALVQIYYDSGRTQAYEHTPYRGYLSTVGFGAHFGLGASTVVDSLVVTWPGGRKQRLLNQSADRTLVVDFRQAGLPDSAVVPLLATQTLFRDITPETGIQYVHQDSDFVDFNIQKLLPHKYSEFGPGLAAGDVNGDGLDDLVVGGSAYYPARVLLQGAGGRFLESVLEPKTGNEEDQSLLLFDAEGDGDLDLYIASGGYEGAAGSAAYQDRLYANDGKGRFSRLPDALPRNHTSKMCVRGGDYDRDGDLDLFVSGRVEPGQYPKPVSSLLLRNDSKPGSIRFTDVTASVAPALNGIGLVCDALFSDIDNDGWSDLVLAGEWMPVTLLKNTQGRFANQTAGSGLESHKGWWNTLVSGDIDSDGDMDYIAGNLGRNSFYRASAGQPVRVTAKDFDNNGSYDALLSLYLPVSFTEQERKEFPAHTRDELIKQVVSMKSKFQNYKAYAQAGMADLLSEEQRKGALQMEVNYLESALLRNDGKGRFTIIALPLAAQVSVLNGMLCEDVNGDGHLDLMINGNDFGTEVSVGYYDALNGLVLLGDGRGGFRPLRILESGMYLPGNGKALVKLRGVGGQTLVAASQNRGPLKLWEWKKTPQAIPLQPGDVRAQVRLADGRTQLRDLSYGHSFLSQSARFLSLGEGVESVLITDGKGQQRTISLKGSPQLQR